MGMILFIKNELTLVSFFAFAQSIFFFSDSIKVIELTVSAKHFKYYADCSVTLCPGRAKIRALCELHSTL
jgi:hypothetical protein